MKKSNVHFLPTHSQLLLNFMSNIQHTTQAADVIDVNRDFTELDAT